MRATLPILLCLALAGCARSNLPGLPPPPILLMDITIGMRGTVDPSLFYFVALMVPEVSAPVSVATAPGGDTVVLGDMTGVLKDLPVTVTDGGVTIADFVTSIVAIDQGSSTVTLEDPLPQGVPVGGTLEIGTAAGLGPWPAVSGEDRGLRWTRYLLYSGHPDLTGGLPDFLFGLGGTQVGAGGEEESNLLQPPERIFLEDWYDTATVLDLDEDDVDTPVQNALRFTIRKDVWLGGADQFALQIVVASGGGVDQVTNPPGLETGLVVDALDVEFVLASGFVEGYEVSERFVPVEFPLDASPAAADIVWWEVSVR